MENENKICKCCDDELKSQWETFRGTCDQCVELYKMGAYPMGFPNKKAVTKYFKTLRT